MHGRQQRTRSPRIGKNERAGAKHPHAKDAGAQILVDPVLRLFLILSNRARRVLLLSCGMRDAFPLSDIVEHLQELYKICQLQILGGATGLAFVLAPCAETPFPVRSESVIMIISPQLDLSKFVVYFCGKIPKISLTRPPS